MLKTLLKSDSASDIRPVEEEGTIQPSVSKEKQKGIYLTTFTLTKLV